MNKLFEPGLIVKTASINQMFTDKELEVFLERHLSGDFGTVSDDSKEMNKEAIETGDDYILSVYPTSIGKDIWIKTEYDRSVTTILFPEDY